MARFSMARVPSRSRDVITFMLRYLVPDTRFLVVKRFAWYAVPDEMSTLVMKALSLDNQFLNGMPNFFVDV